jgi:hypothetical protein
MMRVWLPTLGLMLGLAACGSRDIRLHDLDGSSTDGPEEFAVLPVKSLQQPDDFTTLPTPTPGGANLTDPTPKQDGLAALGGRPSRLGSADGAIPATDAALVRHSARFGGQAGIRETLAAEDEDFRRRQSRFTKLRVVRTDRYILAYRRLALDPYAEVARWRRAGAQVPSAPPAQ